MKLAAVELEREVPLWPCLAACAALLLGAAASPASPLRVVLFTLLAGLPPLLALRPRSGALELVTVAPAAGSRSPRWVA